MTYIDKPIKKFNQRTVAFFLSLEFNTRIFAEDNYIYLNNYIYFWSVDTIFKFQCRCSDIETKSVLYSVIFRYKPQEDISRMVFESEIKSQADVQS